MVGFGLGFLLWCLILVSYVLIVLFTCAGFVLVFGAGYLVVWLLELVLSYCLCLIISLVVW